MKHLIRLATLALPVLFVLGGAPLAGQTAPSAVAEESPIRPGDVVRLTVMREEDLSGDFPVNRFGTVVLPLVGEYDVSGETDRTLRSRVIHDLQAIRQARDIELVVLRRVRVVGEVNEPGIYPLDPTMTVADAVATASGRTQFAQEGKVVLWRNGRVVDADLRADTPLATALIQSGDEIFVPRRGWLDLNLTPFVMGAGTLAGILVTLLR